MDLELAIKNTLKQQKKFFSSGKTLDIDFRIKQLKKLRQAILNFQEDIQQALYNDLHKSSFEAYATEIGFVLKEITIMLRNLKRWSRIKRKLTPLTAFSGKSYILFEPFGNVLIISPWNYPFQLLFAPLVGAIAAGNTVILKPSPYSKHTSEIMSKIIEQTFDSEYIAIFQGHRYVNQALLSEKFDFIFFTGSPNTGKVVMEYAAKNLTPVILELGGKSPTIVDYDANIKLAAKSIVFGKLTNAGQTCIAPDYLFVHEKIKDYLLEQMVYFIEQFYGKEQSQCKYYPKIIKSQNVERLSQYLSCGKIFYGGHYDVKERYFQPTILTDVNIDSDVMKYEIFGPILPVLEFENIDEVISFVKERAKPLAFYYFSTNKRKIRYVLKNTTSGGVSINDTLMHFVNPRLPFGGIGSSGMGRYHGKYSFEAFSNKRAVYHKNLWIDLPFRYLPTNKLKEKLVKMLLK